LIFNSTYSFVSSYMTHASSNIFVCLFSLPCSLDPRDLNSFPTRRSSDLRDEHFHSRRRHLFTNTPSGDGDGSCLQLHGDRRHRRSEEHTSELQSLRHLVCRLLLEKKKK